MDFVKRRIKLGASQAIDGMWRGNWWVIGVVTVQLECDLWENIHFQLGSMGGVEVGRGINNVSLVNRGNDQNIILYALDLSYMVDSY